MLGEVCAYLRNYFYYGEPMIGKIEIANGALIEPYGLKVNQYFRIVGSMFNDGVYQYPLTTLKDEVFDGAIRGMAVPSELISLISDIDAWQTKYGQSVNSPYAAESISATGYSRSKGSADSVGSIGWQNAFSKRLARWRKL